MMKILFRMTFAIALVLVLTATGLWAAGAEEEPTAAADKKYVTDPVTGKVVTAPEYGGTLTFARRFDIPPGDVWFNPRSFFFNSGVIEKLAIVDWAIDRDTYAFVGGHLAPLDALTGALAESWDISPDGLTYTFNIREGVNWHDKPPVNGRELTAKDVEYNFHRLLGNKLTGTEFSAAEPSPGGADLVELPFESVTATDKYTVVMKLKEPRLDALNLILDSNSAVIQPPEIIEQYGDMQDWRNIVGTGPFMLTNYVEGSSITYIKNPNYWGYDEKYPENRLPYIEELRSLYMAEVATTLAGLRSGKIDFIGWPGSQLRSIDQVLSLQRTDPELVISPFIERSDNVIRINTESPPFDDVRVRQAMQMALDLETMNATYFSGYADTTPRGLNGVQGWSIPFEEWPEEIKQYHRYDPEGADELLDEAGYPRGADGIRFKTTYLHWQAFDVSWAELLAAYFRAIGIHMDVLTLSNAETVARLNAMDWELNMGSSGTQVNPFGQMRNVWSGCKQRWCTGVTDAQYDALYEAAVAATTREEQKRLTKEMDMRFIEQFWYTWGPMAPMFNVHQPWIIGYNGEGGFGAAQMFVVFSRLWIDSELKEVMGY